jgi:hypothetical protein
MHPIFENAAWDALNDRGMLKNCCADQTEPKDRQENFMDQVSLKMIPEPALNSACLIKEKAAICRRFDGDNQSKVDSVTTC